MNSQPLRPATILLTLGAFVLGLAATAFVIHSAIRRPLYLHADVRSEKLAMLAGWHGRYFSAAFGSSHVHNGFDPRAFDRAMAAGKAATQTVNLAVEGGSQSEQYAMAQAFLRQLQPPAEAGAPPQPCLVLLELTAGANFSNSHLIHPRAINIYDWQTARLISRFSDRAMPLRQRVGRTGYAVAASALHYMNVGMLSNLIFNPPLNQEILVDQQMDDRRGQKPERYSAANAPAIERVLASRPAQAPTDALNVVPGYRDEVQELEAASPVKGVSFAYFVLPLTSDVNRVTTYPESIGVGGQMVPILNLAQPARYPKLYDPMLWHDPAHLDVEGAQLASTLLAEQLTHWYQVHGAPPMCGR